MKSPHDIPVKKKITPRERKVLKGLVAETTDPNLPSIQKILSRPHVAVTFEAILDEAGLNEASLAKKVADVVKRKPTISTDLKTGRVTTNQPSIDTNTLSAVKMIWQAQGKFVEKTEVHHSGSIQKMGDDQLDNIIEQGQSFLNNRVKNYEDVDPNA